MKYIACPDQCLADEAQEDQEQEDTPAQHHSNAAAR